MVNVQELESVQDVSVWMAENPHLELAIVSHILALVLAGQQSKKGLCRKLGLPESKENMAAIGNILKRESFELMVAQGRQDMVSAALDYVRGNLMKYCLAADEIAMYGQEERNRLAALKDLMDRGGTASALKVSMSTPTEYAKLMKDMLADPAAPKKDGA
jgi:hypothetical protein